MPLRVAPLPLQFAGGIDSKTDSKQVPATKLLDLQNATFIKQTTLSKRNGYKALGNTILQDGGVDLLGRPIVYQAFAAPQGLGVRSNELVKFDSAGAYSYLPQVDQWSRAGDVMSVTASSDPVARTGAFQQMQDAATNNGVTVVAWEDNLGGVWYSVLEADSRRVVRQPTLILASGGQKPRCIAVGTVLHVLYAVPASNAIYVLVVNPVTPTVFNPPQVLVSELYGALPLYDACPTTFNADLPGLIVFVTPTGGGYTYKLGYISPSGVLGSPLTGLPSVVPGIQPVANAIGCAWSSSSIIVMGCDAGVNPGPFYDFWSTALVLGTTGNTAATPPAAPQRIAMAFAGVTDAGQPIVRWAEDCGTSNDSTNSTVTGYVDGAGVVTVNGKIIAHGLGSRAWTYNGDAYVALIHPVKFFSYVAVIKLKTDSSGQGYNSTVAARLLPGQSPGLPARKHLCSVNVVGSDVTLPLLYRIQLSSKNGDQFSEVGIRLYDLDFNDPNAWQTTQLGRGLYISGACLQHYDGDRVAEADFACAPDSSAGAVVPLQLTGGNLTLLGTYDYQFVYEEVDGQGELHRGPTSVPAVVTLTGSNNLVGFTIPTLTLTAKRRVRIGVFRSVANDNSEFFRCSSIDITQTGAIPNAYVLNDPQVAQVAFLDAMDDETLKTQEPLYTNGGILSNDPPSYGGGILTTGMNRLFWSDPDDPSVIRYSQERADETAVETANALSMRLDPYGGALVAIGIMDGAVFGFCETAIYGIVGSGPDETGGTQNTSFSPPQLVTSDVGCKSAGSICQSPVGITFQSSKGIMLLGRDRSVVDIGHDVYKYNDQTIVRSTLLPDRHQILFLTNAGRTLLYDYEHQQWSTFTNHEGLNAVVVEGVYHYLRTDGRVFKETPGLYKDDNAHIPMIIETAWIKLTGYLQGWQRVLYVYWLGTFLSKHILRMRYRINYQAGYSAPIDMEVNTNYNPSLYGAGKYGVGDYGGPGGSTTVYQRRKHLNKPCQAISFQIQDVEATDDYGASFQLSELLLIGGVLGPAYQPGAARS